MRFFAPEEVIQDHPVRQDVVNAEKLGKVSFPNAESETLETIVLPLNFLKFYDPHTDRFDVRDDELWIGFHAHMTDVIVGRKIRALP